MSNPVCQTTLAFHSHTQITARFDGGNLTSDAGWLLFGSLDRQDRLCEDPALARTMHEFLAAGPGSSALTAFPTLGLLDRVHDYYCGALGRKALSERRFRPFASKTRALSGLAGPADLGSMIRISGL